MSSSLSNSLERGMHVFKSNISDHNLDLRYKPLVNFKIETKLTIDKRYKPVNFKFK